MRMTHTTRQTPREGSVFVYPSNLAAKQVAGPAKVARVSFGASKGVTEGRDGMTYAIPVKDENLDWLPGKAIAASVRKFVGHARENPDTVFHVTLLNQQVGGPSHQDMADVFADAPENCSIDNAWAALMFSETDKPLKERCGDCCHRQYRLPRPPSKSVIGQCAFEPDAYWFGESHDCHNHKFTRVDTEHPPRQPTPVITLTPQERHTKQAAEPGWNNSPL